MNMDDVFVDFTDQCISFLTGYNINSSLPNRKVLTDSFDHK